MNKPEITEEQAKAIELERERVGNSYPDLQWYQLDLIILRDFIDWKINDMGHTTEVAKHFNDFWTLSECLNYGWTIKTPERKLLDEIDKLFDVSNEHRENDPFHEGAAVKIHEVKNKVLRYFKETGRMPE